MENKASLENQNRGRSKRYHSCYLETVTFLQFHLNLVSLKSHDMVLTLASSYRWTELAVTLKRLVPLLSTSNHNALQVLSPYFIIPLQNHGGYRHHDFGVKKHKPRRIETFSKYISKLISSGNVFNLEIPA